MAKSGKSSMSVGKVAAIGVAIGGLLGLLFAPKSGRATRKDIARTGRKLASKVTKRK